MPQKELQNLLSLQNLQKIQDNYSTALGIPISIRDSEGNPLTKPSNVSHLWELIHAAPAAENNLISAFKIAIEKSNRTNQITIFERHPDTHAFLAPISNNGRIIAHFIGGLVRFGNPNLAIAEAQTRILQTDLNTYLDAYLHLPLFTKERLEAAANLIKNIGSTLSNLDSRCEQQNTPKESIKSIRDKRYRQFFEYSNDGMYVADFATGEILEANQSIAEMLHYSSPKELTGLITTNFYLHPADRQNFLKIIAEKKSIQNWIAHLITSTGEEKCFETNSTLIKDHTGKEVVQGTLREIHSRHHRTL